ncbi:MAG: hypothetical protein IJL89_11680 [Firmicutes bacterium]|nr:hypothetical protein [Bacillota bacterium]
MGRQINYYMEYESFIKLAEKAVSLGCEIVLYDDRKIVCGGLELIVPGTINYRFYLPKAGELKTRKTDFSERIAFECLTVIEAGYSYIDAEEKRIRQNRLYVPTGYYDNNGEYIYRPESLDKVYGSLMRYVKKLAPYTEITTLQSDNESKYTRKEYVTPYCLELIKNSNYR